MPSQTLKLSFHRSKHLQILYHRGRGCARHNMILHSLNVSKATGADGISARLLKLTAPSISNSLTLLFNHSLQTGSFPDEWKHAKLLLSQNLETNTWYRTIVLFPNSVCCEGECTSNYTTKSTQMVY
jgi:hypothetical protein